jgi:hypothetical protein
MLHPQWRDFLYQLLQRRMQMSVRSNNMMPFYKTFISIEVGHRPPASNTSNAAAE